MILRYEELSSMIEEIKKIINELKNNLAMAK